MSDDNTVLSVDTLDQLDEVKIFLEGLYKKPVSMEAVFQMLLKLFKKFKNTIGKGSLEKEGTMTQLNLNAPSFSQQISKFVHKGEYENPIVPSRSPEQIKADKILQDKTDARETIDTKYILIECQICGDTPIMMPVPKKYVLNASEPVVDVSYLHGNPKHVVVAQLDHDFQVRRRRASNVVYEENY